MRLIGLTGKSGSGKSTLCVCARSLGIPVLDCDAIYRELTDAPSDCLEAIRNTFGEQTVRDGALYRPALREMVYHNEAAMEQLNAITATYMKTEVFARLSELDAPLAILDAPTLFACGMDACCDVLLCVIAPEQDCVRRICKRDGISEQQAKLRLRQQPSDDFLIENCDLVLYNEGSQELFEADALALLNALRKGE